MTAGKLRAQTRYVRRTAARAIADRLRNGVDGIVSCERDPAKPSTVLLHLNSGGNGLAAEQALLTEGYHVEWDHLAPRYGVLLHVGPAVAPAPRPGRWPP